MRDAGDEKGGVVKRTVRRTELMPAHGHRRFAEKEATVSLPRLRFLDGPGGGMDPPPEPKKPRRE